ncbi:mechanosensitive ion channel family protein, partial [Vibrio sp. D420a]|nr:mechanosensitive ion channel family protein [Vibrio sp. D420a]
MMNFWRYLLLMLALVTSVSFAESIEKISETQDQLMVELAELQSAHEAEKPFLEDILRRKNQALRDELFTQLSSDNKQLVDTVLGQQVTMLEQLLEMNEVKIVTLSKENRTTEGEAKKSIELRVQKRIGMMDDYYRQLAKTLTWSSDRGIDVAASKEKLKKALIARSQYLTNAILYTDTQRQDLEKRLGFVGTDEKATI